jgi:hypothetical protein
MNWKKRFQGLDDFWKINGNEQIRGFRIVAWIIFTLFLFSYLIMLMNTKTYILSDYKYIWKFLFFHVSNISFVIISWFVTFYSLKLLRAFFIFIDPNDKIGKFVDWTYNHPFYKALFIPYIILYIY